MSAHATRYHAYMTYVALLRGINVGGKNKVDMKLLKSTFEHAGMKGVRTYINSGNVIFSHDSASAAELERLLEHAIEETFGFSVKVLLHDAQSMAAIRKALPDEWVNDTSAKCDVMFLWDTLDQPDLIERLTIKPGIDDVRHVAGALLWRVERSNVTRSGMMRLVGTAEYQQMTVRNCNTLRKLASLVEQAAAEEL